MSYYEGLGDEFGQPQRIPMPRLVFNGLGAAGKPAAPRKLTPTEQRIAAKQAQQTQLQAQLRDSALAKREAMLEKERANLFYDKISGEQFKPFPFTLTELDLDGAAFTANVANRETTIGSYTVPNGTELLFRSVKQAMSGELDRSAPYMHGKLQTAAPLAVPGLLRIKVFDSTENDLKGQAYVGSSIDFNNADPIDWNKRLFYTCERPVRAKGGDRLVITLKAATVISPLVANSYIVLRALQLSKQ